MAEPLHTVLVPGLLCTPRLYAPQLPALWRLGSFGIADHRRDATLPEIAQRLLAAAPPRFALVGLSMGGYIAFEVLRQAPQRVVRLVLLDTTARGETAEQTRNRRELIDLAQSGNFDQVPERLFPLYVHRGRHSDAALRALLRQMAEETGADAFVRQETAILHRPDSRPGLSSIRCPTTVLVGDGDVLTPPEMASEIASGIPGARLIEIADCGHLSTVEQPTQVAAALVEALAGGA
jgi:pimeloyl-ACP methyl ester carboxylesterase